MKSPSEVAAPKAEFFDDFQVRVGRFAGGADLSKRYARELHGWLTARHRGDELGYSIAPQLEAPKPLRDWMTPEELRRAAVAENRATVSRWLKGKNLPRRREFRPLGTPCGSRRRVAAEASPHLGPRHQPGVLADRLHASGA